jgi:Chaperone of endosialidase
MKRSYALALLGLAIAIALDQGAAQAATFTYHGSLQDSGKPAEGKYDLELTLYSALSGGSTIGGPLVLYQVPVHAGSFSTQADFGPLSNIAGTAWLGVKVRPVGKSDFAALDARAPVSADATASVCPGAWTLAGNSGNPPGSYLGTADATSLVFQTSGQVAMTISPPAASQTEQATGTNVVAGYSGNSVASGVVGATIAGGGGTLVGTDQSNLIVAGGDYATVSGGLSNHAGPAAAIVGGQYNSAGLFGGVLGGLENVAGPYAFVGGGLSNTASGTRAVVAGGNTNMATGTESAVAGGKNNTASGTMAFIGGGSANIAGGDFSYAGGFLATVRNAAQASSPAGCSGNNTCGDFLTFVWSDGNGTSPFTSTAPQQFLVHSAGGVGINTAVTFPYMMTVAGNAGPITGFSPQASSEAVFENNGTAFVEMATPLASESGILFTLVGHPADGGVIYNNGGGRGLQLRTAGNIVQVTVDSSGNTFNHSGTWSVFSDRRLKRDIAPIEHPLDKFLGLQGTTFEYVDPAQALATPGRRMGFIAQDVERVLPQWVSEDSRGYKLVTMQGFEALTVEAMRDLRAEKDAEITVLQDKLDSVQGKLDEVLARLGRLEEAQGR